VSRGTSSSDGLIRDGFLRLALRWACCGRGLGGATAAVAEVQDGAGPWRPSW